MLLCLIAILPRRIQTMQEVRHYHQRLVARGVQGYPWDACWYDYQLAAMTHLFSPLQQWADNHWPGFWWNRVGRMLQRFHDLECVEILPG